MIYHPTVSLITDLLKKQDFWYETFEHEPVRTSEEAAKLRTGYGLHQGAKALILRIKKEGIASFVMLVCPGDKRLDNDKVKAVLGARSIRFALPEEIASLTGGIEVGGIPPFGNLFGLTVYVDKKVLSNDKIIFNAGDRRFSLAIESSSYVSLVNPKVVDIT